MTPGNRISFKLPILGDQIQPVILLHSSNSCRVDTSGYFPSAMLLYDEKISAWSSAGVLTVASQYRNNLWKKQRIFNLLVLCLQCDDSLARYYLELNDQLCYGIYSCSMEGTQDPAVATSCYARKFSCSSCLKDWSKGAIYKIEFLWVLPWLSAIEVEVPEEKV